MDPSKPFQEPPSSQSLSLDFSVTFDVDVIVALENTDMIIRIFDSKTLDQSVLMLDGTTLALSLLLSLFELLSGGIFLQSDVEKHFECEMEVL